MARTSRVSRDKARDRAARHHEDSILALIPLCRAKAKRRGAFGITAGELRVLATNKGLLPHRPKDRRLSFLWAVMPRSGLVATDRTRLSPLPYSRNQHRVYVSPAFAGKGAAA